ncbi:MAG: hypothetical protein CVU87_12455 [Firmicutes bacterium HGW-Firmicutes-12]|jgi:2-dehydropantoate 2-reductase|nr:MAG: hypothetical protein CVU87_12455 [Firmicutes bacterium HGW-Firmicutes-12]
MNPYGYMGPGWKRQQVNTCGTIVIIVSQVFFVGGIYKMKNELNPRILIFGAGVIGSIFAGKLANAGFNVTILARNERFRELVSKGLILEHSLTGERLEIKIPVINKLEKEDNYDFIIVAVQNTQINEVLPTLADNNSKNIVFVINNPSGYEKWVDSVGRDRVLIGFPSAGGVRENGEVYYFIGTGITKVFQATTFGEISGKITARLKLLIYYGKAYLRCKRGNGGIGSSI